MTETPLWGQLFGTGRPSSKNYVCNDGKPVPAGQLICPEEQLDRGNGVTDALHSIANFIPGLAGLAGVINLVNNIIGNLLSGALGLLCNGLDAVSGGGCTNIQQAIGQHLQDLGKWFISAIVPSPFTNDMSGGRSFDMAGCRCRRSKQQVLYGSNGLPANKR